MRWERIFFNSLLYLSDNLLFKAEKSIIDAKTMNSIQNECTELKHKYDACYTVWFTDRFLKGDTNDEMCAPFFAMYQQCLKVLFRLASNFLYKYVQCEFPDGGVSNPERGIRRLF